MKSRLSSFLTNLLLILVFVVMISGNIEKSFANVVSSNDVPAQLVWTEFGDFDIFYSTFSNGSWNQKQNLSNSESIDLTPTITSRENGEVWTAWTTMEGEESRIFYCALKDNIWSEPRVMPTPFISNTSPSIVVDNDQTPWMVWSGYDGQDSEIFFSIWNGVKWSYPLRVHPNNTTPDILPEIYVDLSGDLIVQWKGYNGDEYETYFRKWNGIAWSIPKGYQQPSRLDDIISNQKDIISHLLDFLPDTAMGTLYVKEYGPFKIDQIRKREQENTQGTKAFAASNTEEQASTSIYAASVASLIIAFGDSITEGYCPGGCVSGGYVHYLNNLFDNISQNVTVRNYGVGGETSNNGVNRINSVLSANSGADYTLIMEGTNDYWSGISRQTTVANLGIMIDKSRNRSIEPIIATLTPDTRPQAAGKGIPTTNTQIRSLAGQKGARLADQYNACIGNWGNLASSPGDFLHPNNSGYQVIAQTWFNTIPNTQPPKPIVSTGSAGSITTNSAKVYGTVNPNGQNTNYYFVYGTTTSYGANTASTNIGSGTGNVSVSASLSGLTPNTTYHYKVVGSSAGGIVTGGDRTFTTQALPKPTVSTGSAGSITTDSAKLYGTINPNGQNTNYYFRYGTTTSYGANTASTNIGSGTGNVSVSASLSGLIPNTTYHYKVVGSSAGGIVTGGDRTFTTQALPPTIASETSSSTTQSSATLNGMFNPNGSTSQYYFEYGITTSYGSKTAQRNGGSGTTSVSVSEIIQGLKPFTTYHYRLVVVNGAGIFYGSDSTFRTNGAMPWTYLLLLSD